MVAITATNSATLSLQASVTKSRLEQAQREAAQAEANAEALRAQAQEQDHVAEKAHARERSLNASQTSGGNAPPVTAPVSSTPKMAGQSGASYVETLDTVLQGPNSPAQSAYTFPVQKSLVLSNLFQRANLIWQATPPDTRVAKLYGGQGSTASGTGSLLSVQA